MNSHGDDEIMGYTDYEGGRALSNSLVAKHDYESYKPKPGIMSTIRDLLTKRTKEISNIEKTAAANLLIGQGYSMELVKEAKRYPGFKDDTSVEWKASDGHTKGPKARAAMSAPEKAKYSLGRVKDALKGKKRYIAGGIAATGLAAYHVKKNRDMQKEAGRIGPNLKSAIVHGGVLGVAGAIGATSYGINKYRNRQEKRREVSAPFILKSDGRWHQHIGGGVTASLPTKPKAGEYGTKK